MGKKHDAALMEFVENAARKAVEDSKDITKDALLGLQKNHAQSGLDGDAMTSAAISYLINFAAVALTDAMLLGAEQVLADTYGPYSDTARRTMKKSGKIAPAISASLAEIVAYTIKTATVNFDKFFLDSGEDREQARRAAEQAKAFLDKIMNKD